MEGSNCRKTTETENVQIGEAMSTKLTERCLKIVGWTQTLREMFESECEHSTIKSTRCFGGDTAETGVQCSTTIYC